MDVLLNAMSMSIINICECNKCLTCKKCSIDVNDVSNSATREDAKWRNGSHTKGQKGKQIYI